MPEPPPSPFPPHPPSPHALHHPAARLQARLAFLSLHITAIPVGLGQEDRCLIRGDTLELRELQGSLLGIPSRAPSGPLESRVRDPVSQPPGTEHLPSSVGTTGCLHPRRVCAFAAGLPEIFFLFCTFSPLSLSPFLVLPGHFFRFGWHSALLFVPLYCDIHLSVSSEVRFQSLSPTTLQESWPSEASPSS